MTTVLPYLTAFLAIAVVVLAVELRDAKEDLALEKAARLHLRDRLNGRRPRHTADPWRRAKAAKPAVPAGWAPGRTLTVIDTTGHTQEHPLPALTTGGGR